MTQPGATPPPALPPGHLSRHVQPRLPVADLVLRPWEPADVPALVRAYADPDISRWHARSLSPADAETWVAYERGRWAQERGGSWAVTRDGAVLGRVALGQLALEEARAEVSYWVLPEARGRGTATLSVGAVADWAFDEVGLHRLELHHATGNEASCRVATRAGFAVEGTRRQQGLHLDGWHDMHAHGLLAGDPRPRAAVAQPEA